MANVSQQEQNELPEKQRIPTLRVRKEEGNGLFIQFLLPN